MAYLSQISNSWRGIAIYQISTKSEISRQTGLRRVSIGMGILRSDCDLTVNVKPTAATCRRCGAPSPTGRRTTVRKQDQADGRSLCSGAASSVA